MGPQNRASIIEIMCWSYAAYARSPGNGLEADHESNVRAVIVVTLRRKRVMVVRVRLAVGIFFLSATVDGFDGFWIPPSVPQHPNGSTQRSHIVEELARHGRVEIGLRPEGAHVAARFVASFVSFQRMRRRLSGL